MHTHTKKILHIASWYPSESDPFRTPFIPAHFNAINHDGYHELLHIEVRHKLGFPVLSCGRTPDGQRYRTLTVPTQRARLTEILTALLLILTRLELGKAWWSGVHVHIAWPLIRFPKLFRFLFGKNVLVGEHWSAYHAAFNLPIGSAAHKRMAKMFSQNLPITAVSNALANDITKFGSPHIFKVHVIPNVVDPSLFYPLTEVATIPSSKKKPIDGPSFLMVASWQEIKRPLLVLMACEKAARAAADFTLRIIGDGPQLEEMKRLAAAEPLQGRVTFLGPRDKHFIAEEMRHANALLHPSAYETFSVVCAEAISCGTPVLASRLDAIGEFIDDSNGVLVENTVEAWTEAILHFCLKPRQWDHASIAAKAHARFSPEVVGRQFRELYRALWQQSS